MTDSASVCAAITRTTRLVPSWGAATPPAALPRSPGVPDMPFTAGVEQARVVKLSGDLTAESTPTLRRLLATHEHVLVECSGVDSIDDAALDVLGELRDEAAASGCMFYVCGLVGGPLREAQVRGFSHFLCGAVAPP